MRTVKDDSRQQGTEKEESVADMVTRAVEALFAEESLKVKPVEVLAEVETVFTEELEVKPVEVLAEVAGLVEIPDSCTVRPVWWSQCDKPFYDSSVSDTSGLSEDDLEDIVMNWYLQQ